MVYTLIVNQGKVNDLKSRVRELSVQIDEQSKVNEENLEKEKVLERLKVDKKVDIEKYEEVDLWNKEIIDYLQ